ncbi:hypothetical protein ACWC4J_38070 [Streptomyces sp. NPDC001356]
MEQMRSWFGRPLWEMEPPDADTYFGKVLRASPNGTRLGRSLALTTYFLFLELRQSSASRVATNGTPRAMASASETRL